MTSYDPLKGYLSSISDWRNNKISVAALVIPVNDISPPLASTVEQTWDIFISYNENFQSSLVKMVCATNVCWSTHNFKSLTIVHVLPLSHSWAQYKHGLVITPMVLRQLFTRNCNNAWPATCHGMTTAFMFHLLILINDAVETFSVTTWNVNDANSEKNWSPNDYNTVCLFRGGFQRPLWT